MADDKPPRPMELSIQQITDMILVELSIRQWIDISDDCPDPDAQQCLAVGSMRGPRPIFMLARYADFEEGEYRLVSQNDNKPLKTITAEQFKLEWLWGHALATTQGSEE